VINLVLNARDAMPDGGKVTIETGNAYLDDSYVMRFGDIAAGQYVLLSVTDTGSGMSPEILDRVFDPFFTTKSKGEGSGLGLSMIHGFVRQSNGHLRVYSEVGQGTCVKIYLPRYFGEETPSVPSGIDLEPRVPARAAENETILVVEDNDEVRAYARSALAELGYNVFAAADAETACNFWKRRTASTSFSPTWSCRE
jgi:hypothetical protein